MIYLYCTVHEEGCAQIPRDPACRFVQKEVGVIFGRGPECVSRDCPLLYGGECLGKTPH